MSERREIARRLAALDDIAEIMAALKSAALVELTRLRRLAPAQVDVAAAVRTTARTFLAHHPGFAVATSSARPVCVLLGSERGFCGGYDQELVAAFVAERARWTADPLVVVSGRRLAQRLERVTRIDGAIEAPSVADDVRNAIPRLVDVLASLPLPPGEPLAAAVRVLHHASGDAGGVRTDALVGALTDPSPARGAPPRLYLSPEAFFAELADHLLFALLHAHFHEALLAENERRVQHLEGALGRVDGRRAALRMRDDALRQEEITEEIEMILLGAGGPGFDEAPAGWWE